MFIFATKFDIALGWFVIAIFFEGSKVTSTTLLLSVVGNFLTGPVR